MKIIADVIYGRPQRREVNSQSVGLGLETLLHNKELSSPRWQMLQFQIYRGEMWVHLIYYHVP